MRFGAEAFGQGEDTTRGEKEASGWSGGRQPPWGARQARLCGRLCSCHPPPRTPRLTSAALPVSSNSPPSRGPESRAPQGHGAAGARGRAGTCAEGLYRCWETPGHSGSVVLAPELRLDVHGALLAPGRAGSPLPWGCVRAETGPSPRGHWGQGGPSASSPTSPASQAPGGSVKTP